MKTMSVLLVSFLGFSAFAQVGAVVDVTLSPMGSFKGKANDVKGAATVSGDTVTAENIVINMKTFDTGIDMRTNHARNKYLEVEKYPEAVLVKGEGKGGTGKGTLKIHGVEHEVSGTYTVNGDTVTAKFPLKLSDFKIEGINYKGVGVEDSVNVTVTVPVKKAAAAAPAKK